MPGSHLSRRRLLAAGPALLTAGPAGLAGCTGSAAAPEPPDPLEPPARRAEIDSALAGAVAQLAAKVTGQAADPALATAAQALAADRAAHAITLRTELRRVRPEPATGSASPAAPMPPLADPELAGARATLIHAVQAAQDEAATLVITLPGYRAALLASVAACCASHTALLSA
ncbi:MAG: hypothetical protein ACRDSR_12715 [Pseudonocardiaceae bacterium]